MLTGPPPRTHGSYGEQQAMPLLPRKLVELVHREFRIARAIAAPSSLHKPLDWSLGNLDGAWCIELHHCVLVFPHRWQSREAQSNHRRTNTRCGIIQ
jgi:hypothetical protein